MKCDKLMPSLIPLAVIACWGLVSPLWAAPPQAAIDACAGLEQGRMR